MSQGKQLLFDNDEITDLLMKYRQNGQDPMLLVRIIAKTNPLLSAIASKYSNSVPKQDLLQEARLKLVEVLPRYDPKRAKLYSFIANVARNVMVDYVRKHGRTDAELFDIEDESLESDELDLVTTLQGQLMPWFLRRFSTMVEKHLAGEALEGILTDIIDPDCSKRQAVTNLEEGFGYERSDARLMYEVVLIKLRILSGERIPRNRDPRERSYEPELIETVGMDRYEKACSVFSGLSMRFYKD